MRMSSESKESAELLHEKNSKLNQNLHQEFQTNAMILNRKLH